MSSQKDKDMQKPLMPQEQGALRAFAPKPDGVRKRRNRRRMTCKRSPVQISNWK